MKLKGEFAASLVAADVGRATDKNSYIDEMQHLRGKNETLQLQLDEQDNQLELIKGAYEHEISKLHEKLEERSNPVIGSKVFNVDGEFQQADKVSVMLFYICICLRWDVYIGW